MDLMSAGRSKQPSKQQIKTHRTSIKNQSVRILGVLAHVYLMKPSPHFIIEDKKQLNFE